MVAHTAAETRLYRLLNAVAIVAALLTLATLIGTYYGPVAPFFTEAPFVSNAVAGLGLIALLAWFAAADVRRFRPMILVLIGGLALGAAALVALCASQRAAGYTGVLLAGAGVCAVLAAGLLVATRATNEQPGVAPWMTDKPLTTIERVGRVVYAIFGALSIIAATANLLLAFVGPLTSFFGQPLFVAGSVMKIALLSVLALLAARDIRRYSDMGILLVLGHVVSLIALAVTLAGIDRFGETRVVLGGITLSTRQMVLSGLALDGVVTLGFAALQIAASRARLDYLGFMTPTLFRAIEGLAECLFEADAPGGVAPHEVALRLDRYLSSFPSARLAISRLAILGLESAPLLWLRPPFSFLAPAFRREFVDKRYKNDIAGERGRHPLLDLIQVALRIGMQGAYIGYYSDQRVQERIGYTPFSRRYADYDKIQRPRKYPRLQVTTPADLRRQGIDVISSADVVIIGSGAGGAILAEQLADQGREVLILEKGQYIAPDDFSEDEIDMVGRLYSDGALQVAQSYRFQVIQGNCVGGSTVVNNAVCFDTPESVLQTWNDPGGANAGIDEAAFRRAQAAVKQRLAIQSIKTSTSTRPWEAVLNPGDRVIADGIAALGLQDKVEYDVVRANIADCLGCGYCNIGCKFGRKLSMLDEVLPRAQRDHGAERFRILSEAQAIKLNGGGGQVREIAVQLRDGRRMLIRNPKTVIVSAGVIASSWLLMRSGIGQGELPVGRHICFNMGSPLHGYWPSANGRHLNSYAGLQIAHYLRLPSHPGFIYETWFNPPVTQAMAMPGWLDQHYQNMQHYSDMSAVGVLVGTEPTGYLTSALLLPGTPDLVYKPTEHDLKTLVEALIELGQIMLAGGAERVLASTMSYKDEAIFRAPADLQRLHKLVKDDRDLVLGTGHPQGGNAMSRTRGQDRGVIGPDFKVYGYDNLYVCDASVFPSATTVNPQLTIMTMAHYAAEQIR